MLQDFLANRPSIQSPASTNAPERGFQPLFASRPAGLAAKNSEPDPEPDSHRLEAPQIEIVREGGQVRRIVVTCTCCEKITIDCEY